MPLKLRRLLKNSRNLSFREAAGDKECRVSSVFRAIFVYVPLALLLSFSALFYPPARGLAVGLDRAQLSPRGAGQAAPFRTLEDQGVFLLSVAGNKMGEEKFQIHPSGVNLEARAEIELRVARDGQELRFKTYPDLLLNLFLQPLTYHWRQEGSESSRIQIDFREGTAQVRYHTVNGRRDNREFDLPRDVVILDDNVVDQYEIAAWRYNMTSGGKQQFPAFIPQEALPGTITVEDAGAETLRIDGKREECTHLVMTTNLARVDLWMDSQHRLERLERGQFVAARKH